MINWKERQTLKYAREILRGGQKWLRINRDLLAAKQRSDIEAKLRELEQALRGGMATEAAARADEVERRIQGVLPAQKYSAIRENVEVLLVAVIVAMAVRTFFIQPFKIPTGSMQPTLYGIYPPRPPEGQYEPACPYGEISPALSKMPDAFHQLTGKDGRPPNLLERILGVLFGEIYEEDGYRTRGDHIFVDKMSYHFRQPHRGEVVVFNTAFISRRYFNRREDAYYDRDGDAYVRHPVHGSNETTQTVSALPQDCSEINPRGGFYIKRLVGLGGDHLEIRPPFLYVNGAVLDGRPAFRRIYSRQDYYSGYLLLHYQPQDLIGSEPQFLNNNVANTYTVPPGHFFVLGDNSRSSLDGRFWGPIPRVRVVGRAVFVYWPFTKRFGVID